MFIFYFFSLFISFFSFIFCSNHTQLLHQHEELYLNKLTSIIHNITNQIQLTHSNKPLNYAVCMSNGVRTYGGLGNFIGSLITATLISLVYGRVLIINNQVITSMFIHPNSNDTFISSIITSTTRMYAPGECLIIEPSSSKNIPILGVNRCNQALVHNPIIQNWFSRTFNVPKTYQLTNKPWLISENRISYDILHWLLSKPAPKWEKHIKEHALSVFKNCSRDGWEHHRANLAIQVRTFADISKDPISKKRLDCYLECAFQRAKILHEIHQHPVCVLVTSDNSELTDLIIGKLSEVPYITAVHNDYPTGSTISHSADLLLHERDNQKFTIENLHNHPEFVDWMLLSDSESAIYTTESTFATTARFRAGFVKSQNDMVVRMADNNNVVCDAVVEKNHRHKK